MSDYTLGLTGTDMTEYIDIRFGQPLEHIGTNAKWQEAVVVYIPNVGRISGHAMGDDNGEVLVNFGDTKSRIPSEFIYRKASFTNDWK